LKNHFYLLEILCSVWSENKKKLFQLNLLPLVAQKKTNLRFYKKLGNTIGCSTTSGNSALCLIYRPRPTVNAKQCTAYKTFQTGSGVNFPLCHCHVWSLCLVNPHGSKNTSPRALISVLRLVNSRITHDCCWCGFHKKKAAFQASWCSFSCLTLQGMHSVKIDYIIILPIILLRTQYFLDGLNQNEYVNKSHS
jgi:hypothetical protein